MMAVAVRKGRAYAPQAVPAPTKVQEAPLIAKPAGPAAPEIAQPAAKQGAPAPKKEALSVAAKEVPPSPKTSPGRACSKSLSGTQGEEAGGVRS